MTYARRALASEQARFEAERRELSRRQNIRQMG
jgi:hypothetical protein